MIIIKNEIVLLKNNFIYIKNIFTSYIKIPNNFIVIYKDKILNIFSKNFNKSKKISFVKNIKNLICGVKKMWEIEIYISGVGYKIYIEKNEIFFNIGYTSIIKISIPYFINIEIKKEKIIIKSVYKDKLGIFAFKILQVKKFDPYKKKGIYLENNFLLKKSSKKKQ